jgi:hypothetical protein
VTLGVVAKCNSYVEILLELTMEDHKGRSMQTPIYLRILGVAYLTQVVQGLSCLILLSHPHVALVAQVAKTLSTLSHF